MSRARANRPAVVMERARPSLKLEKRRRRPFQAGQALMTECGRTRKAQAIRVRQRSKSANNVNQLLVKATIQGFFKQLTRSSASLQMVLHKDRANSTQDTCEHTASARCTLAQRSSIVLAETATRGHPRLTKKCTEELQYGGNLQSKLLSGSQVHFDGRTCPRAAPNRAIAATTKPCKAQLKKQRSICATRRRNGGLLHARAQAFQQVD